MAAGLADVVETLGGLLIKGVTALQPSTLAKTYVWLRHGEHPDDTYKRAKELARSSFEDLARAVERIDRPLGARVRDRVLSDGLCGPLSGRSRAEGTASALQGAAQLPSILPPDGFTDRPPPFRGHSSSPSCLVS